MKATVDRAALMVMIEYLIKEPRTKGRPQRNIRHSACAARVFGEANGFAAGLEALVLEDGKCQVHHKKLLQILETYHPKENVTLATDDQFLHVEGFRMRATHFEAAAHPPGNFQTFPVRDAWVASGGGSNQPNPRPGQGRPMA